ncbi:hypothetical protein HPG69_006397 [Diceros bicornis minor]|uniref:Uncharacterized protein n=1 Tax=Diceros bicornis minor TaxID=77932 RepID=A0A7J7EWS3_DICBM|nr:hypothetical protein HPG69_006397 [Diceros bicornis minor]
MPNSKSTSSEMSGPWGQARAAPWNSGSLSCGDKIQGLTGIPVSRVSMEQEIETEILVLVCSIVKRHRGHHVLLAQREHEGESGEENSAFPESKTGNPCY